jgi:hypothetical protein
MIYIWKWKTMFRVWLIEVDEVHTHSLLFTKLFHHTTLASHSGYIMIQTKLGLNFALKCLLTFFMRSDISFKLYIGSS